MRSSSLLALLVVTGCATQPKPLLPLGVSASIVCGQDTNSYRSERYPRVALSDTTAFVETSFGVTEHPIQGQKIEGTKVEYVWQGGDNIVELDIDENGRGHMYSFDPRWYQEKNAKLRAFAIASAFGAGNDLKCQKIR